MKESRSKASLVLLTMMVTAGLLYKFDPLHVFHEYKEYKGETTTTVKAQEPEFQRMNYDELIEQLKNSRKGDVVKYGVKDNEYIEWKVLDERDGKILVISRKLLDHKPYNNIDSENNIYIDIYWEMSDIRSYLNNEMYNSYFNSDEQRRIIDTEIQPEPVFKRLSGVEYETGSTTYDKLFLLSIDEVKQYMVSESSRLPTNKFVLYYEPAKKGVLGEPIEIVDVDFEQSASKPNVGYTDIKGWLLRDHIDDLFIGQVYDDGTFERALTKSEVGVRPAMWIDLSY